MTVVHHEIQHKEKKDNVNADRKTIFTTLESMQVVTDNRIRRRAFEFHSLFTCCECDMDWSTQPGYPAEEMLEVLGDAHIGRFAVRCRNKTFCNSRRVEKREGWSGFPGAAFASSRRGERIRNNLLKTYHALRYDYDLEIDSLDYYFSDDKIKAYPKFTNKWWAMMVVMIPFSFPTFYDAKSGIQVDFKAAFPHVSLREIRKRSVGSNPSATDVLRSAAIEWRINKNILSFDLSLARHVGLPDDILDYIRQFLAMTADGGRGNDDGEVPPRRLPRYNGLPPYRV
jgi:hypothetical protein